MLSWVKPIKAQAILKIIKGKELKTEAILEEAIELCVWDDFEQQHAVQVAKLSLKLFDKLQPLHRMGNSERIWLRVANNG